MLLHLRILMMLLAAYLLSAVAPTAAQEADKQKVIWNDTLTVAFDESRGLFTVQHKPSGKTFVTNGRLSNTGGKAALVSVADKALGDGQAIEVSFPGGNRDRIMLFPKLPFVLVRSSLSNGESEMSSVNKLPILSAGVDLGNPPNELRVLGTGGLTQPAQKPGSYAFLAVADPQTRNGVVGGWLTHDRG